MKGNRAVLIVIAVFIVVLAAWWVVRRGGRQALDLMTLYGQAQKDGEPWREGPITLAGVTKPAISAPPNGRLHLKVHVPPDGWLQVSLGLKPEAWTEPGDGVYFFVGVSDGHQFDMVFTQTVNPYQNASERRWVDVSADLSAYAGEDVELVFNTRSSGPNVQPDTRNDLPVWGDPRIISR